MLMLHPASSQGRVNARRRLPAEACQLPCIIGYYLVMMVMMVMVDVELWSCGVVFIVSIMHHSTHHIVPRTDRTDVTI